MRFRIDPPNCGCTDCLIGEVSRPLDFLVGYDGVVDEATGASLVHGYYLNASGYKIRAETIYIATPENA